MSGGLSGHADPVVGDAHDEAGIGFRHHFGTDRNPAAPLITPGAELDRVAHQVVQHLSQPGRVGPHLLRHVRMDEQAQFDVLVDRYRQHRVADAFDQLRECNRRALKLHPAGLDLREVQYVVDDAQKRKRGGADRRYRVRLWLRQLVVRQNVQHSDHPVHRRSDLVAHRREKRALGAVGRLGGLARLHQLGDATLQVGVDAVNRLFGPALVGDVEAEDRDTLWRRQNVPLEPGAPAIGKDELALIGLRNALLHAATHFGEGLGRIDAGESLHQRAPDQRFGGPPAMPRRGRVDEAEAPVEAYDLTAFEHVVEGLPVQRSALLDPAFELVVEAADALVGLRARQHFATDVLQQVDENHSCRDQRQDEEQQGVLAFASGSFYALDQQRLAGTVDFMRQVAKSVHDQRAFFRGHHAFFRGHERARSR